MSITPIRERNPVGVALAGLVVLGLVGTAAYRADSLPLVGGGTTYTANFSESAGLSDGDEVRIAGVKVGEVTGVSLDGAAVKVSFRVKDAWIGNSSTVGIAIKTLLGDKYLAVDPLGTTAQDPDHRIGLSRTTSPYDVTQAFNGLGETIGEIDTDRLAESFDAISDTFKDSPANVRSAADGLSALSRTVSERDAELATLLKAGKRLTKTLDGKKSSFEILLEDGNLLLGEIQARRDSIHLLLTGTKNLGIQLGGLVEDNEKQLGPTLDSLGRVTAVLVKNQKSLDQVLSMAGDYNRLVGNTLGNGRWFDNYVCGVVPKNYLPEGTPPATGCMPPKQEGGS
ncbi:MCE family protein [uncultured Streptomyces sp.]|uniref:MCE family protein n=1 Tax=uncultured Streptomyces sp. TaxID=174707 RepID=UPI00261BFB23|nr:MCE family protein [uncultured Streptomyces sp.]